MQTCAKIHLQQCRISKISEGAPGPRLQLIHNYVITTLKFPFLSSARIIVPVCNCLYVTVEYEKRQKTSEK